MGLPVVSFFKLCGAYDGREKNFSKQAGLIFFIISFSGAHHIINGFLNEQCFSLLTLF